MSDFIQNEILKFFNKNGFNPLRIHITSTQLDALNEELWFYKVPECETEIIQFAGIPIIISDMFALIG